MSIAVYWDFNEEASQRAQNTSLCYIFSNGRQIELEIKLIKLVVKISFRHKEKNMSLM